MKIHFLLVFFAVIAGIASAQEYPAPDVTLPETAGRHIVQTMHLLETSNAKHRNKVKILVYGQSISKQTYWIPVRDELQRRYPYADIEMKNLSIGGFSTQTLWKTVEMDVVPFYPDLVIFHCYGSDIDYERIMQIIRSRTAAEVMIHTDHYTGESAWSDTMCYNRLPRYAEQYGLELVDVRHPWIDYLEKYNYSPDQLVFDGAHLNDHGLFVMSEILKKYFVYRPEYLKESADRVTYIPLKKGKPVDVEFDGNRIDVVIDRAKGVQSELYPLIDGKKPSEFPSAYTYTRPNNDEQKDWPWETGAAYRIVNRDPQTEDWTLTCTAVDSVKSKDGKDYDLSYFEFTVCGSKTGFDGVGRMGETFVSNSGRVVIDANDWWLAEPFRRFRLASAPGYTITWKTIMQGDASDTLRVDGEMPQIKTVVQGLPNGKHRLRMEGSKAVRGIKVYKPYLREMTIKE
ncbi:MAG: hypothetical protein PUB21_07185 [Bacteroidales bacterium]|nr:hypothetical protein [Bacteroidales bacterium]